ncbi:MAG: sugar transferase [Muribaculaceae bacterium]|nr:sugar transferase [Muribaculaceae bacterium]
MRLRYVAMDLATSVVAFFLFNLARYYLMDINLRIPSFQHYITESKLIIEQIAIPIVMLGVYWLSGYYNKPFGKSRFQEFSQTFFSAFVNTIWIYFALLINDQLPSRYVSYELMLSLWGALFLTTYIGRLCLTATSLWNLKRHLWSFNTVIIGDSDKAIETAQRLSRRQTNLGYYVIGHIPIDGETSSLRPHKILTSQQLETLNNDNNIDQLIISVEEGSSEKKILDLLYNYFPTGIPIKIKPSALAFLTSHIRIGDIYAEPFIDLTSPTMSDAQLNVKRVIDILFSMLALIILSPIMIAIAVAVKCSSKGPVIYKQERIGYRQKPFNILKFRSMTVDAERNGPQLAGEDDPRITGVGHFLRKYRLDELPQFWNVIKGDMSLVGPRPEREYYIRQIIEKAPHYTLVHQVKPGITSWGMVKYGYAQKVEEMVERCNYDLIYLSNMSVAVDFKILLHTISTVILGKGK